MIFLFQLTPVISTELTNDHTLIWYSRDHKPTQCWIGDKLTYSSKTWHLCAGRSQHTGQKNPRLNIFLFLFSDPPFHYQLSFITLQFLLAHRIAVKCLLDYACLNTHVDEDCEEFINFCAVFEQMVSHRLRREYF